MLRGCARGNALPDYIAQRLLERRRVGDPNRISPEHDASAATLDYPLRKFERLDLRRHLLRPKAQYRNGARLSYLAELVGVEGLYQIRAQLGCYAAGAVYQLVHLFLGELVRVSREELANDRDAEVLRLVDKLAASTVSASL